MAWGTHMPVLIHLVNKTTGPILELGTGLYSTPFLHWACFDKKRELVSYDSEEKYFNLSAQYGSDYHQVNFVIDWDHIPITNKKWDIAFIDNHPGEKRKDLALKVKDCARFIILHDAWWKEDAVYQYKSIYPFFKYTYIHPVTRKGPTAIVSNFEDVESFYKGLI